MAATMTPGAERVDGPPASSAWTGLGFAKGAAHVWRHAGWSDPSLAAEWLVGSPHDAPAHLHSMNEAGYAPDQLRRVARSVRRHVAAWTEVTAAPAAGGDPIGRRRAQVANIVLDHLVVDLRESLPETAPL